MVIGTGIFFALQNQSKGWMLAIIGGIVLLGILLAAVFTPLSYVVTKNAGIIRRPIRSVSILVQDIEEVYPSEYQEVFRKAMRFGSGGLFGIFGFFHSETLPSFHAYMTRTDRLAVVKLKNNDAIVLSPDDLKGFVQAVQDMMIKIC